MFVFVVVVVLPLLVTEWREHGSFSLSIANICCIVMILFLSCYTMSLRLSCVLFYDVNVVTW